MRRGMLCSSALVLLVALAGTACAVTGEAPERAEPSLVQVLHVSPDGTGDCSAPSPCGSITQALDRAEPGATVLLQDGVYGAQVIEAPVRASDWDQNVDVRPQTPGGAVVEGIEIKAPHVTVRGLTSTGDVYIRPAADNSGFVDMVVQGGTAYVTGADNAFLVRNRVMPADNQDGVQIKGLKGDNPMGLRIVENVIGPTRRTDGKSHLDCIQILGGSQILLQRNTLFHCASQGLLIASGAGGTVGQGIIVERNNIHGCPPGRSSMCDGFTAVLSGAPGLVFIHNTATGGSTKIAGRRSVIANNIISRMSRCPERGGDFENNLYLEANSCAPDDRSEEGRRVLLGTAGSLEAPADVHLRPDSAGVDRGSRYVGRGHSRTDIDGDPVDPATADVGADEAPELRLPKVVGAGGRVDLQVLTRPSAVVEVLFRPAGERQFAVRRRGRADRAGVFRASFNASVDHRVFAAVGTPPRLTNFALTQVRRVRS